jgi:hypothetical protein
MHHRTPVLFNHHQPIQLNASTINRYDMNTIKSTKDALKNKERILIVTPLRNGAQFLPKHFELVSQLTYPHELIDLAFLVSDSSDDTLAVLAAELDRVQNKPDPKLGGPFASVTIAEKDFGIGGEGLDIQSKHSFEFQGPRRKAMGKARNYLLSIALKPDHSWVYWRDIDIVESPPSIIEDFIKHDRDVLVPSKCRLHHKLPGFYKTELLCNQISGFTAMTRTTMTSKGSSTTILGRSLKRDLGSLRLLTRTPFLQRATKSTTLNGNIWRRWETGIRTRTKRLNLMPLVV